MLSLSAVALSFAPAPLRAPQSVCRAGAVSMESAADLKALADKCNPLVGFWDPMNLAEYDQWSQGEEAAIGFLRHAEIKHGRVAMAAFVGYIVQANGIHFPWGLTRAGVTSGDSSAAGGPADQGDALPTASKLQILGFVALFEFFGENSFCLEASGEKHYMRGGKPGFYPDLKKCQIPHPVPLTLWDPFGFTTKLSAEKKATSLIAEINNGRLAMLGIMGFVAASKVEGSVPALTGVIKPYAGEVMAPFAAGDVSLPYVADMLKVSLF